MNTLPIIFEDREYLHDPYADLDIARMIRDSSDNEVTYEEERLIIKKVLTENNEDTCLNDIMNKVIDLISMLSAYKTRINK